MHRLMHTRHFWRFHKWHHSPTYMYWLAGCRATVQQQFPVGVPYINFHRLGSSLRHLSRSVHREEHEGARFRDWREGKPRAPDRRPVMPHWR
ncbi:sterol desaturase family protein [Roseiarcus sp.]|uniref:sterol desaturase family protein n=1 Tax=Roseiarcus sp. TaxID=1969460 RepID=UPI003F9D0B8B